MKETISNFLKDIAHLDEVAQVKRMEDFIVMQVENFILWNWSDDEERKRELASFEQWMKEIADECEDTDELNFWEYSSIENTLEPTNEFHQGSLIYGDKVKQAIMRLPDDNRRHILLKELGLEK